MLPDDKDPKVRYDVSRLDSEPGMVAEPRPYAPHESPEFARLLDLIGRRWTANVLRQLLFEAGRFNKMSRDLGINPNTLRVRLVDLENEGLVSRIVESNFPPKVRYELTERGKELAAILDRLLQWASERPATPNPRVAEAKAEYTAEDPS